MFPESFDMKLLSIAILLLLPAAAAAEVRLPDVIAGSMVVQQKQNVPIWGWADPGESVTVEFAGQKRTVTAGGDGKWLVKLGKLGANAVPQTMVIRGRNTIELTDILIGEVWLVAGQSNMQWRLPESENGEADKISWILLML